MKASVMKEVADGIVALIRRHVAENREMVESRVKAGEMVVNDLRKRVDELEAKLAEIESRAHLRRIA